MSGNMSGNIHHRHASVDNVERIRILTCGCDSYTPGHHVHWIQARIFSKCPPEKIVDAQLEGHDGNHFTVTIDGERHTAWHANPHAVAAFAAIAARAQPGHTVFFRESSLLAASNGQTSALIYADLDGEERPCRYKDATARPMPRGSGPGLIWIDQPKNE